MQEELNGPETMIATGVLTLGVIGGAGYLIKRWLDKNEAAKLGKEQADAAKHAAEPEYKAALSLSTLFSHQMFLNTSEKQTYQTVSSQITDKEKLGKYYLQLTGRNLVDDVNKYISAASQEQANKNSNANADAFSSYKVLTSGKAISNVNTGELVVPRATSFNLYTDLGADKMKATLWKHIGNKTSNGKWQPTGKGLYVGEVIEFQAKWLEDPISHSVKEYNLVQSYINRIHTQEKVFFKVWGVDNKTWYWVDAIEFKRLSAKAINGLSGVNLMFS